MVRERFITLDKQIRKEKKTQNKWTNHPSQDGRKLNLKKLKEKI